MPQEPQSSERRRAHIWVNGRVQGVGFRAFVQQVAYRLGLGGWVRNVGWDTVEAVAEGKREEVERFIEAVKAGPRGSLVEEARLEWEDVTGEPSNFEVKRSV